jgi:hypothetical protein
VCDLPPALLCMFVACVLANGSSTLHLVMWRHNLILSGTEFAPRRQGFLSQDGACGGCSL